MKIKIITLYDGWQIWVGSKMYYWDHNSPDLGADALVTLFKDLGYEVEFEEDF